MSLCSDMHRHIDMVQVYIWPDYLGRVLVLHSVRPEEVRNKLETCTLGLESSGLETGSHLVRTGNA